MSPLNNVPLWIVSPFLKKLSKYIKKEHYSNFCTFEIACLLNVLRHYFRKYGKLYFGRNLEGQLYPRFWRPWLLIMPIGKSLRVSTYIEALFFANNLLDHVSNVTNALEWSFSLSFNLFKKIFVWKFRFHSQIWLPPVA